MTGWSWCECLLFGASQIGEQGLCLNFSNTPFLEASLFRKCGGMYLPAKQQRKSLNDKNIKHILPFILTHKQMLQNTTLKNKFGHTFTIKHKYF